MADKASATPTKASSSDQAQPYAAQETNTIALTAITPTATHTTLLPSATLPPPLNPLNPLNATQDKTLAPSDIEDTNTTTEPIPAPAPHIQKLQSQISSLQSQILTTQATLGSTLADLHAQDSHADPDKIVQEHIRLLHQYNEIKDVGQGLMGLIADARGVRLGDVMEEFGVCAED